MSYIANSCDSSGDTSSIQVAPQSPSSEEAATAASATHDCASNHRHLVKYSSDHSSIYHIVPSSASSASSSAISGYTLPPHMQYYHSHHYMTNSPTVDNAFNLDASNDLSIPEPSYSALSEKLRKSTPNEFQCSLFCGGKRCKYESGKKWRDEDKAMPGLYSHWITDEILAMSRPNTESIVKFNLIDAFKSVNIKSIINLQEPGEHAHCGNGLHSSGFSYDPQLFMKENIYFYNFQWKDYTPTDVNSLLDMVKVMAFALTEGRIAVHCHAGLGRTGVVICCFLIFIYRCKAREAISFVRSKRPYSVQMKSQIENVYAFAQFFMPLVAVYPTLNTSHNKNNQNRFTISKQINFTLQSVIKRQQILLHGYESRHLKFIPKILYFVCEKLLQLCNKHRTPSQGLKWHLVTSLSHALDELLYSRSRESCCTSSTSSVSSSCNLNFASPLTKITDFQIANSSESFTRYFLSSVPDSLINNSNSLFNTSQHEVSNGRLSSSIASLVSASSSSVINNTIPPATATSSSACSSHTSFTATEPVIHEETDEEDLTSQPNFIISVNNSKDENTQQNSSVASSSDSLNNYTGDSPTSQSPSSEVNFICSNDLTTSSASSNKVQQIHDNLLSSASIDNCNQSMPPVEGDFILTANRTHQVSKMLSKSKSCEATALLRVNTSNTHDNCANNQDNGDDHCLEDFTHPLNPTADSESDARGHREKLLSPQSSPGELMRNISFDKKKIFNASVAKLLNGQGEADENEEPNDADGSVDNYAKVKNLLENATMYVDPRALESGELIDEESPSYQSISSSSRVTTNQEYSEILREYEKESTIGMVDNHFVIDCLLKDHTEMSKELTGAINTYQKHLNESPDSWDTLSREINVEILCGLFWSWLENITEPILNKKSLIYVVLKAERPLEGLGKLDKETRYTLEYLLRFIVRLQGDDHEGKDLLTKKLLATLTHQSIKLVQVNSPTTQSSTSEGDSQADEMNAAAAATTVPATSVNVIPANRPWPEMRRGTKGRIDLFLKYLYSLLQC